MHFFIKTILKGEIEAKILSKTRKNIEKKLFLFQKDLVFIETDATELERVRFFVTIQN